MSRLLRLVYVSKATFTPCSETEHVDKRMQDILVQARRNNRKSKIGGALFFADGYFFQCLEGKESAVYKLLEKIKQDSRHESLKISYCKAIQRRHFRDWTMKYVPVVDEVKEMMINKGYLSFTPIEFDESDINWVVDAFSHIDDTSLSYEALRICYRPQLYWLSLHWLKKLLPSSFANS